MSADGGTEGSVTNVTDTTLKLVDGTESGLTLHTVRRHHPAAAALRRPDLDAFFNLLPGTEEEDLARLGD